MALLPPVSRFAFFFALAVAAQATPVFEGYAKLAGRTRFALSGENAQQVEWLELGANFAGYTLKTYDPETQTLTVDKKGQIEQLTLRATTARKAVPAAPGSNRLSDDLKIRLRSLGGLELATELARMGDPEVNEMMTRLREIQTNAPKDGADAKPHQAAAQFIEQRTIEIARARAEKLLQ